jgi:hypothetical protein
MGLPPPDTTVVVIRKLGLDMSASPGIGIPRQRQNIIKMIVVIFIVLSS